MLVLVGLFFVGVLFRCVSFVVFLLLSILERKRKYYEFIDDNDDAFVFFCFLVFWKRRSGQLLNQKGQELG